MIIYICSKNKVLYTGKGSRNESQATSKQQLAGAGVALIPIGASMCIISDVWNQDAVGVKWPVLSHADSLETHLVLTISSVIQMSLVLDAGRFHCHLRQ